jgi:hypothetical protein
MEAVSAFFVMVRRVRGATQAGPTAPATAAVGLPPTLA